jgi:two-component sensor histidine kinase
VSVKDIVNSAGIPSANPGLVNGVELQAHGISQLLSAVLDNRPLLKPWMKGWEYLWIVGWGLVGIGLGRMLRSPWKLLLAVGVASLGLTGICYGLLLLGWWVPVVPAMMGLIFNGTGLTAALFYRYEQEIRSRLKDRQQVIDQTFDAIHNGPLQQLAKLLRDVQDNASVPPLVVTELQVLNQNLRAVYDSIQQETLNQVDRLSLGSDLDLDLQKPLSELLEAVYEKTMSRDLTGFMGLKMVVPQFDSMDDRHLTPEQKRSLCRFLEEALCNVGKHAIAATKLWIFCGQENNHQVIRVKDNGTGSSVLVDSTTGASLERRTLGTRQAIGLAKRLRGTFQRRPNDPHGTICELLWSVSTRFW